MLESSALRYDAASLGFFQVIREPRRVTMRCDASIGVKVEQPA